MIILIGEWYLPEGFLNKSEDGETSNDDLKDIDEPIENLLHAYTLSKIMPNSNKKNKKKKKVFIYEDINNETDIEHYAEANKLKDEKESKEQEK